MDFPTTQFQIPVHDKIQMQRDILSAYLSRYVDPESELLSIEEARNSYSGMEQSLLDGWLRGSNQSARTEASLKSPIPGNGAGCGTEQMSSASIAREESEPVRVNETCVAS
jgi:putative transposase